MTYIPNPKLEGSNIVACVPQDGFCKWKCPDCFFNRPGNYLGPEPKANVPPVELTKGKIVRVNDVNDSWHDRGRVLGVTRRFKDRFYNTSWNCDLSVFEYPVVLTANPHANTDITFHKLDPIPENLMFVRARVNVWNARLIDEIVDYYTAREVCVILTYMAYYETPVPVEYQHLYMLKRRTLNEYWRIKPEAWYAIAERYCRNPLVFTCGIGPWHHRCKDCGNCTSLYVAAMKRLGLPLEFVG